MGRIKFTIWIVLLGWLWLQPALAQHPLEAGVADHDHHCLMCALHLDGNQALPPSVALPFVLAAVHQASHVLPAAVSQSADPYLSDTGAPYACLHVSLYLIYLFFKD